jgi:D-glycero-alpha-D-manno-heptose-7-phosphate kinase
MLNEKVVITKTPLRISFVGGGTDMPYFYNKFSGATISCAINKYIYVTAKYHNNFQEKYRLNYSTTENVKSIDEIKNLRIRDVIKKLKITRPLYINTFADIPTNSGLGSSSSFTVGLIHALSSLENKNFSKKKIAEMAYDIEARITNNSLGKQDHYIASFGGIKHIQYKKNRIKISSIILDQKKIEYLFNSFLLVWTGKNREAINVLKDQKKNIKKNYTNLNLLNNFTKDFLNEIKNKKLNIKKMGKIVSETWNLKKNFSKLVTTNYINRIYNEIINKLSYGGKLLGAGNGGFILIMFDLKKRKKIIKSLKKYQYLNVKLEKNGTVIL